MRLQSEGLGEGQKITRVMHDVEAAAKRLSVTGARTWGVGFQRQIDQLKLTREQIGAVEQSWVGLHNSMKSRNLAGAVRSSEIANWKTQTVSHLANARSDIDRHFKEVEARAKAHAARFSTIMKPVFVGMGFYTAAYGAGMAGRGGLKAASEQTRTKYRMELANIPAAERDRMGAEAQRLSSKYGSIDEQDVLEINKTAWALFGGDGDRARAMLEPVIRTFIADVTEVGADKAGENLSSFLKAMDNLNVNEGVDGGVGSIGAILEGWVKAKQVEGKDLDVGDVLGFAQRAKVAKYALSDDFLTNVLPALRQDMGFDSLGDALSGAYQNFVTPSAGGSQGQYVKRQKAAGLRDENNSLIERDLFASNPYRWANEVLKPILTKNGVDTGNTAALAEAVKKLMSNSKAAAAVVGWIEAQAQIDKNVALYKAAKGTEGVEEARFKNPFAAADALLASLRNFAAAVLPMESIAAGLNVMADGVNRLAAAAKDNPFLTALGIGGAGVGAYGAGKYALGKLDMFGLNSSAIALDGSAAALTRAAVALGGAGVADSAGGMAKKGGLALLSWPIIAGAAGVAAGVGKFITDTSASNAADGRKPAPPTYDQGGAANLENYYRTFHGVPFEGGMHRAGLGAGPSPSLDNSTILQQADDTARALEDTLAITARPIVDTSSLDNAIAKARTLKGLVDGANASAGRSNVAVEMRRNMAD